jgi:hypothetical protein
VFWLVCIQKNSNQKAVVAFMFVFVLQKQLSMAMKKLIHVLLVLLCLTLNGYSLTWIQGSYTGNGTDNHVINGLGFQPEVVIVKGAGATAAVIKMSSLGGANSKTMDVAGSFAADAIKGFSSGAFTVGTNSTVNSAGVVYYFIAFDAGTDLVVSSYTGDGNISQTVTGPGFASEMVIIFSDNAAAAASASYITSGMPAGKCARFGNMGLWGFSITALTASGFTVGSNNNANLETYYYAAFKSSATILTGSYAGSASDKIVTTTGITPRFVMEVNESAVASARPVIKLGSMPATTSAFYSASAVTTSDIIGIGAGNFTVKAGSENANNTTYTNYYVAFGNGGQLPIELQDFDVACENGAAKISWITSSENNNDYFTIERSEDGVNFEVIGKITGAGNSTGRINYQFFDQHLPNSKTSYYRLKQTDYDGKYEYFDLKSVVSCDLVSQLKVVLYPNPVSNQLSYQFELENSANVTVEIVNALGRTVYREYVNAEKGNQLLKLDVSDLENGIYLFKINDGVNQVTKRITKQ